MCADAVLLIHADAFQQAIIFVLCVSENHKQIFCALLCLAFQFFFLDLSPSASLSLISVARFCRIRDGYAHMHGVRALSETDTHLAFRVYVHLTIFFSSAGHCSPAAAAAVAEVNRSIGCQPQDKYFSSQLFCSQFACALSPYEFCLVGFFLWGVQRRTHI